MKVLFDTNVILDSLLKRSPFEPVANTLIHHVEFNLIKGYLCSATITTIYYVAQKDYGKQQALYEIQSIMNIFEIAAVDRNVFENSIQSEFNDFEDTVIHSAAIQCNSDCIVTRKNCY